MTRSLIFAVGVATLVMAAAPAGASQRPARPPLPSPMPPVVQMAADDPMSSYGGYWDGTAIHVDDVNYKFGVAHEAGHVFDEQYLDPGERQRFAELVSRIYDKKGRLVGHDGRQDMPWFRIAENPDGTVTSGFGDIGELFADAYASARLGRIRAPNHMWDTAYGYEPTEKQHRLIAKFMVHAALDRGAPITYDNGEGWR